MDDVTKKKKKIRIALWAVFAGVLLGVAFACLAIWLLPIGNVSLTNVALLVGSVSLFVSAKPDNSVAWFEFGTRSRRTWLGFALGVVGFVLALAALFSLNT